MSVDLGLRPDTLTVTLQAGAGFTSALTNTAGDWATGDTISLRFSTGQEWFAAITGPTASWDVAHADVDAVIAANPRHVGLWYVNGAAVACWARGTVTVLK